jgi:hypothetical protein
MAKPRSHARRDHAEAFLPDPDDGVVIDEAEAESFAGEFIASVTGGDFVVEEARNEETDEEIESVRSGAWSGDPDAADDELTATDA